MPKNTHAFFADSDHICVHVLSSSLLYACISWSCACCHVLASCLRGRPLCPTDFPSVCVGLSRGVSPVCPKCPLLRCPHSDHSFLVLCVQLLLPRLVPPHSWVSIGARPQTYIMLVLFNLIIQNVHYVHGLCHWTEGQVSLLLQRWGATRRHCHSTVVP